LPLTAASAFFTKIAIFSSGRFFLDFEGVRVRELRKGGGLGNFLAAFPQGQGLYLALSTDMSTKRCHVLVPARMKSPLWRAESGAWRAVMRGDPVIRGAPKG
jgi:hypothetical protein